MPISPYRDAAERAEMNQFTQYGCSRLPASILKSIFLKHMRDDGSIDWRRLRLEAQSYIDEDHSDLSEDDE